jgi:iron complex transport system substrate-binding protein
MRTPQRLSAIAIAAVTAAAALAGCSSASNSTAAATSALAPAPPTPTTSLIPHWPLTVAAANGRVTIKDLPRRIVSLDPTATEDLYAVGAGTQVVAVDQYSDFPPGAPVTSVSGADPNIGAITKYKPSLVISQNDPRLLRALRKLGIPVLIEPEVSNLRDAYSQIEQIGQATGHAYQADETVANMEEVIDHIVAQAGTKYQGLTGYWEVSAKTDGPYRSATSATLVGHIMAMFGLRNIAATDGPGAEPELSGAEIAATKPQIILVADASQTPAMVAARPGWADIPAVKDHHIYALNPDLASRWGPRLPQLIEEIASALASAKS